MVSVLVFIRTPRPPVSTLFPYTTLFRSSGAEHAMGTRRPDDLGHCRAARARAEHDNPAHEAARGRGVRRARSEEHTSELQSRPHLVCRLLLEKKKQAKRSTRTSRCSTTE